MNIYRDPNLERKFVILLCLFLFDTGYSSWEKCSLHAPKQFLPDDALKVGLVYQYILHVSIHHIKLINIDLYFIFLVW